MCSISFSEIYGMFTSICFLFSSLGIKCLPCRKNMEEVEKFLTTGSMNSENFFVDEDARAPAEGTLNISVQGMFTFNLGLSDPFAIVVSMAKKSPALGKFVQGCAAAKRSCITEALQVATKEWLKIADELDDENADDEPEDTGANVMDVAFQQAKSAQEAEANKKKIAMEQEMERIKSQYDTAGLSKATIDRILSDLQRLSETKHHGWRAFPSGRNLAMWEIELFDFDKGTDLQKDMDNAGKQCVQLTMKFPKEYPYKPPFIRVIRPRFAFHTGRVTVGGSICTELLTDSGWNPTFDVEAIIETIRMQITDKESGARIDTGNTSDYTEAEAREAFERVAAHHKQVGW